MSGLQYTRKNIISGSLIFAAGDTIGAIIINEFSLTRMLGILLVGATVYAFEIPNYFIWITRKTRVHKGISAALYRTGMALLYFNPLWITRHFFFIHLFAGNWSEINSSLFYLGWMSFLINVPVSLLANYIIQNRITSYKRFVASNIFSGLITVYYAVSVYWF